MFLLLPAILSSSPKCVYSTLFSPGMAGSLCLAVSVTEFLSARPQVLPTQVCEKSSGGQSVAESLLLVFIQQALLLHAGHWARRWGSTVNMAESLSLRCSLIDQIIISVTAPQRAMKDTITTCVALPAVQFCASRSRVYLLYCSYPSSRIGTVIPIL